MSWQENLLSDLEEIRNLIRQTKRIAVLGIKTDAQADQPSVYVPMYLKKTGFEIIPVPVYYPEATVILGETVYRRLIDIPGDIDMVDVFRRSNDPSGSNPASAMTPPRRSSPKPASRSCKIAD